MSTKHPNISKIVKYRLLFSIYGDIIEIPIMEYIVKNMDKLLNIIELWNGPNPSNKKDTINITMYIIILEHPFSSIHLYN